MRGYISGASLRVHLQQCSKFSVSVTITVSKIIIQLHLQLQLFLFSVTLAVTALWWDQKCSTAKEKT